jgi:hypothetical protein
VFGDSPQLRDYQFGPLLLAGPTHAEAQAYLDSTYGRSWESEAYLTFDHKKHTEREKQIIQLVTAECAMPSEDWTKWYQD